MGDFHHIDWLTTGALIRKERPELTWTVSVTFSVASGMELLPPKRLEIVFPSSAKKKRISEAAPGCAQLCTDDATHPTSLWAPLSLRVGKGSQVLSVPQEGSTALPTALRTATSLLTQKHCCTCTSRECPGKDIGGRAQGKERRSPGPGPRYSSQCRTPEGTYWLAWTPPRACLP